MTSLRDWLRRIVKGRRDGLRQRVLNRLFGRAKPPSSPPRAAPPTAESSGIFLAKLIDLMDGEVLEVMLEGEPVALCRRGDRVHAVSGTCPHAGGPLGDGELNGTELTCPYHGWSFDVVTGACLMDDELSVPLVPVTVVHGEIRATERNDAKK